MKRTLLILGVLLSLPAAAGPRSIAKIEIRNETVVPTEEIREVLPLREGEPFREQNLQAALEQLQEWGRFGEISAEKQLKAEGWILTLRLAAGWLVNEIRISGNYPYLSRRLRRTIAIHPGDLYDRKRAEHQLSRLEAFYGREGYYGTSVDLETLRDPRWPETVDLRYHVHRGRRFRLGKIGVSGNRVFPFGRFNSALNPLLAYKPSRLRSALEELQRDYRRRGYLEARVRAVSVTPNPDSKKVSIDLEVREGPHVTVRFRGNSRLRTATLKRDLPMLVEGDASLYGILASAEALAELYRSRGFLEAQIAVEREKPAPNRLIVTFRIREGAQTRVKSIEIAGNERIPDRLIKKTFRTKEQTIFRSGFYRPEIFEDDVGKLTGQYRRWGFPDAAVTTPTLQSSPWKDKISIEIPVTEGEPRIVEEIRVSGQQQFPETRLKRLLKMKSGDLLDQELLEADQRALLAYYSDHGYPYAEIQARTPATSGRQTVRYEIEEGPEVLVGEVLVAGNYRTRQRSIQRLLDLKEGKPFSYRKLLRSESSLRKTGVFRSVDIETIGLQEKQTTVHLVVRLEENPVAVIDLDSSFDTDDKFTGSFILLQNNLFGFAKRGNVRFTGGIDIQKGEINYIDPRLLGLGFEFTGGGLFAAEQRPGFSAIDGGGKLSLLREFTPQLSLLTKYEFTRTFFRNVTDPTDLTQRDNTTSTVGVSANYDTRDSFSDPRRGFTLLGGLDVSNKIIASGFDFLKPFGAIAHFHSLGSRVTVLNYLRLEGIKVFGGDVLTRDKRLFLGGDYTVRGFSQDSIGAVDNLGNPTGGHLLLLHSAELQTRIKGEFKFALFADSGSLTDAFGGVTLGSLRHSAGAGLRYVTPIGPLRLDYGIKLDRQPGESASRLHFAFGYAF